MTVTATGVQIGQDADPNKNFVLKLPDVADGSLQIMRGVLGGTLTEVARIRPDGGLYIDTQPVFHANMTGLQSIATGTHTKVAFNSEGADSHGCFNATTGAVVLNGLNVPAHAFMPHIAGWYHLAASTRDATGVTAGQWHTQIRKNGTVITHSLSPVNGQGLSSHVSALVYLNGTTDYVEAFVFQNSGGAANMGNSAELTFFHGHLVRAA